MCIRVHLQYRSKVSHHLWRQGGHYFNEHLFININIYLLHSIYINIYLYIHLLI